MPVRRARPDLQDLCLTESALLWLLIDGPTVLAECRRRLDAMTSRIQKVTGGTYYGAAEVAPDCEYTLLAMCARFVLLEMYGESSGDARATETYNPVSREEFIAERISDRSVNVDHFTALESETGMRSLVAFLAAADDTAV